MSRPPIPIDWNAVGEMLEAGCTGTEVAAYMGIHPETLYRRCEAEHEMGFSEFARNKRARGDALLKLAQFQMAVTDKDKTMAIFLGKNRLGQSDRMALKMNKELSEEELTEEIYRMLNDERPAEYTGEDSQASIERQEGALLDAPTEEAEPPDMDTISRAADDGPGEQG